MLSAENQRWLDEFRAKYGRAPRILHIGNIANNAYLNAKILTVAGIDCDVLCYDYYHVMGCPEWEDADFLGSIDEQNHPDWTMVDLKGFRRPAWFAQGPFEICIDYLTARRANNSRAERKYWRQLSQANKTLAVSKSGKRVWTFVSKLVNRFFIIAVDKDPLPRVVARLASLNNYKFPIGHLVATAAIMGTLLFSFVCKFALLPYFFFRRFLALSSYKVAHQKTDGSYTTPTLSDWVVHWNFIFHQCFPNRTDSLLTEDIVGYYDSLPKYRKLLSYYDVVHGYASDGIFALFSQTTYVAYEHGTIRSLPFQESTLGRLCAITYKLADHVCITNADNVTAAVALALKRFSFIPHPINEGPILKATESPDTYKKLHRELDSDFLVFHPARQHWDAQRHPNWEKGNDIFIKGFSRFVKEVNHRAKAIFVEWGNTVDASRALIKELDISDNIVWIQPQNTAGMAMYISSTDLLADQFFLGAFGSTLPRALASAKPAMLYLNVALHEWCFEEMPPIINAGNDSEVFYGLTVAYRDKDWINDLAVRGHQWYQRYHSNEVIGDRLFSVYQSVLENRNAPIG